MKANKIILMVAAGLSMSMLSGCHLYKKYDLAQEENALVKEYNQALQEAEDSTSVGNLDWRTVFTDPMLQDLIVRALDNNTNLEQSHINVEIAHAQLNGAKLSYLPSVAFAPQGSLSKFHIDGASWGKTYTLPLAVNWEVDVFGKLLNNKRGAQINYERSQAYQQAVRSQIIAGVAHCYYAISTLESQLQLSRKTADLWKENVQVMTDLKEAGRVTQAAVVQSQAQYYSILAQITDIEQGLVQANNSLSLLLNVMPQKWNVQPDATLTLPVKYVAGVPMRELASRPDIKAAELGLAAAYYTTNSARAAFYPTFNISSNGGFTNQLGQAIMNPGKWFISLAASMTAPIFMRGQLTTNLKVAKLQQQTALLGFENAVFSAAADVSNAITAYEKSSEKMRYLQGQVQNLDQALSINRELLALGGYNTTYLEVLTAQQSLLAAQMGELTCRQDQASAIINLYQNLGGGRK